jgi:hypothetical protein
MVEPTRGGTSTKTKKSKRVSGSMRKAKVPLTKPYEIRFDEDNPDIEGTFFDDIYVDMMKSKNKKKDGGLMEAIKKVDAEKGMKDGGMVGNSTSNFKGTH